MGGRDEGVRHGTALLITIPSVKTIRQLQFSRINSFDNSEPLPANAGFFLWCHS